MQAALHKHARAADLFRLTNLLVDGFEIQDVALAGHLALQRPIESAEGAVLSAKVGVVDVAVNHVSDHAVRMQLAAGSIGLHPDAYEVIGAEEIEGLGFGERHCRPNGTVYRK